MVSSVPQPESRKGRNDQGEQACAAGRGERALGARPRVPLLRLRARVARVSSLPFSKRPGDGRLGCRSAGACARPGLVCLRHLPHCGAAPGRARLCFPWEGLHARGPACATPVSAVLWVCDDRPGPSRGGVQRGAYPHISGEAAKAKRALLQSRRRPWVRGQALGLAFRPAALHPEPPAAPLSAKAGGCPARLTAPAASLRSPRGRPAGLQDALQARGLGPSVQPSRHSCTPVSLLGPGSEGTSLETWVRPRPPPHSLDMGPSLLSLSTVPLGLVTLDGPGFSRHLQVPCQGPVPTRPLQPLHALRPHPGQPLSGPSLLLSPSVLSLYPLVPSTPGPGSKEASEKGRRPCTSCGRAPPPRHWAAGRLQARVLWPGALRALASLCGRDGAPNPGQSGVLGAGRRRTTGPACRSLG